MFWALTGHGQPPGALLLASTLTGALVLVGDLLYFQRLEGSIADRV